MRLGEIDFFAVVTRKPTICDFKPVVVEVVKPQEPVPPVRIEKSVPAVVDQKSDQEGAVLGAETGIGSSITKYLKACCAWKRAWRRKRRETR